MFSAPLLRMNLRSTTFWHHAIIKYYDGDHPLISENFTAWGILRKLVWQDALLILGILVAAQITVFVIRGLILQFAKRVPPRLRLLVLRALPLVRLLIGLAAAVLIVPILVQPTFRNVVTLVASAAVTLAFALKDYGSSLVAGLVTVLENTYQPGDWIEVDGVYGEVKSIGPRAATIVTPDDTEVIIPHTRLWTTSIFNASSGNRHLLCVADFHLHPDHDAALVRKRLAEAAGTSPYRKPDSPVTVIVAEKPWGTHYRLKAYVQESRNQFLFTSDLTVRGKEAIRSLGIRFAQAAFVEAKA